MTRKMKDSGIEWIGEIPEDWDVLPLKSICTEFYSGGTPTASNSEYYTNTKEGYPFLNISDLTDNKYVIGVKKHITKNAAVSKGLKIVDKKYILLAMYASVGTISMLNIETYISQAVLAIKPSSFVDKNFLYYFLESFKPYSEAYSRGTTQNNLSADIVKNLKISLTSLSEQKKISTFLDKKTKQIEDVKNKISKEIENLENYKKSVITETVTKGLDKNVEMKDSGIEWIGEIPKHWIKSKVKHACSLIGSGTTPASNNLDFYSDDEINWIQSGDLYKTNEITTTEKNITEMAIKSYPILKIYKSPYLVMAMYGASVGNLSISKIDAATNQACCVMKTNNSTNLFYLYYWLLFVKDDFLRKAEGGSQPNISQDKIKNQIIYFPTILEQNKIANYLNKKIKLIDESIAIKQKQLETLEEYKKSLIYEYVTGKKEVKDGEET